MEKIDKIYYNTGKVLGSGHDGTIVYEGSFDDRVVAVKRVSKDLVKEVQREKLILIESDSHPNVIKYFCTEEDSRYFYLALEKCVVNLDQFVLRSDLKTALAPKDVLSQIANGIAHLHKINIVHRDLKPQNILFAESKGITLVKISDFGISKDMSGNRSSSMSCLAGTETWLAPETETVQRANKPGDVYSLGKIIFFVLMNGRIPTKTNLSELESIQTNDALLAVDLIQNCTQRDPGTRLKANDVKMHPLFWDAEKTLGFFVDVSNRLEKRDSTASYLKSELEQNSSQTCRNDFMQILEPTIRNDLAATRRQTYYGNSVEQLLRALRNKRAHYEETSAEVKRIFGPLPEGFCEYWISKFPHLLLNIYLAAKRVLAHDDSFRIYLYST